MAFIDSSSWKAYGQLSEDDANFLSKLPVGPHSSDFPDVPTLRAGLLELMKKRNIAPPPIDFTGIKKSSIQIPVRDGSTIPADLYQPENAKPGPLVVYFHGGGWCIGGPEMGMDDAKYVVSELGGVFIAVGYRKAPEHVFPTAVHDAWDSVKWAASNASDLGADPSTGFIVSGASAGGNLANAVSHLAIDENFEPKITGVHLNIPALLHHDVVPDEYKPHFKSFEENADAKTLSQKDMLFFLKWYKPDPKSPLYSSLLWPSGHKAQPPTFFFVCGGDLLRDEALIYEAVLKNEGVPTKLTVVPGVPHGAPHFFPSMPSSVKANQDKYEGYKWLASQK